MKGTAVVMLLACLVATRVAMADEAVEEPSAQPEPKGPAKRQRELTLRRMLRGPFQSSRLYTMPSADTVGPYVLSLSGDASLLQKPGLLTSAGVIAVGFGDIAQLEYRHTSAISIEGLNAPVPTVGVQLKIPLPEHPNVPAFGLAFRLGVPRAEQFGGVGIDETVHDLFLVGRLRFEFASWLTLHGGVRVSSAKIVGEIALAPRFQYQPGVASDPEIRYGLLGRFGMRWNLLPSVIIDGSIGYQLDVATNAPDEGPGAIVTWDIRLGAEVFVPWGALACRAVGAFCE